MPKNNIFFGHVLALFTMLVWASTFSSTKTLLHDFYATEILLFRFIIAYVALFILHFRGIGFKNYKVEILFFLSGLSGVCLYFLLENVALYNTTASNAALLVTISPLFVAILSRIFLGKRLKKHFFIGFVVAFVGVALVVSRGELSFSVSPVGDIICLAAGIMWSFYTLLLEQLFLHCKGENPLAITRKIFFYGILCILPCSIGVWNVYGISDFWTRFGDSMNLFNLLFLGFVASALCYVTYNACIHLLGTIKASAYIYSIPLFGVIVATLTLGETITFATIIGGIAVLLGLFLSQI